MLSTFQSRLSKLLRRLGARLRVDRKSEARFPKDGEHYSGADDWKPSPDDYPIFPPPPPRDIIADPDQYCDKVMTRKYGAPQGCFEDSPLYALYRFYEFIVLDRVIDYRNALEAFWRQRDWAVYGIPDPADSDPERYAFLAGCTYLIARSFNQRVKLGLNRNNPPLITPEEAEEARNIPQHLRKWEQVPDWAVAAAPLRDTFGLPTHDGVVLESVDDPRTDADFKTKNILLWTPHISFT